MKEFCFYNEDDLESLPQDFKLVPFHVSYIDDDAIETPKTLTSKKSPKQPKQSTTAGPVLNNLSAAD